MYYRKSYKNVLQKTVQAYNNNDHRTIKTASEKAWNNNNLQTA